MKKEIKSIICATQVKGIRSFPENEKQMNAETDEATVKQEDSPSSNSVAPGDPKGQLAEMSAQLIKSEKTSAQSNGPPMKMEKKRDDSSSSSSSSSSSEEEEEEAAQEEA